MADAGITRRIVQRIMRAGAIRVRPQIPSRTLRRALRRVTVSALEGALFIPHYWAVYVHDGRRGFSASDSGLGPVRGTFLIFYRNPSADPRFAGRQTPERAAAVQRLTRAQFRRALEEFATGSGNVIITRRVKGVRATPFFSNDPGGGMFGFVDQANDVGQFEFRTFALGFLKRPLGITGFIPQLGSVGITIPVVKEEAIIRLGRG